MPVCAHRPEECGFFTPCGPCRCGQEVAQQLARQRVEQTRPEPDTDERNPG